MGPAHSYSNIRKVHRDTTSTIGPFYELYALFRHGAPTSLPEASPPERVQFANFYLKNFSGMHRRISSIEPHGYCCLGKVIGLIFGVLEAYRQKVYVSPRAIQLSLNYLRERSATHLSRDVLTPSTARFQCASHILMEDYAEQCGCPHPGYHLSVAVYH